MVHRIGVLGLTHDHVWSNLADVQKHPNAMVVAAADPHDALLGRAEAEFHARPYTNYETLLDSEELDAVYVFADNAAGPELTELAASRGYHVLVEKPMAASGEGAARMRTAVREASVRLMVNWPFAWWPQMQHAIRLATEGEIGDIWQVRYRAAHAGPRELGCSEFFCEWLFDPARNGPGGAYVDYCCYGALLARVLLGIPSEVTAVSGRFVKQEQTVDDNAVLVMKYPNGLAVSEGSWTQVGSLSAYSTVIYGTQGTLMLEPRHGGRLFKATQESPAGEVVDVPAPVASLETATAHFLHGIETGETYWALCHDEQGYDTQRILDAGAKSLTQQGTVRL